MRAPLEDGSETGRDGSGALEVDFAGLSRLSDTVRELARELAGSDDLCGHMNDPDLADVFSRVDRNWHKQRVTLQTFLDMTAVSVETGLAAYRQLEAELRKASGGVR
jgi:hypothetical protein